MERRGQCIWGRWAETPWKSRRGWRGSAQRHRRREVELGGSGGLVPGVTGSHLSVHQQWHEHELQSQRPGSGLAVRNGPRLRRAFLELVGER